MPPKKKISADPTSKTTVAAATTATVQTTSRKHSPDRIDDAHPLQKKKVAFAGILERGAKKEYLQRIKEHGGTVQQKYCTTTDILIRVRNASSGQIVAAYYDNVPVWTAEQFTAVCKDGWSAVPPHPKPVPPSLQCLESLETTTAQDEDFRRALIASLTEHFERESERMAGGTGYSPRLKFQIPMSLGDYSKCHLPIEVISAVIRAWPGNSIVLGGCGNNVFVGGDDAVQVALDAILARDNRNVPPIFHLEVYETVITDEGAIRIATALPSMPSIISLMITWTGITKIGVAALLDAAAKCPKMKEMMVGIDQIEGGREMLDAWKEGVGKECVVDVC